MRSFIWCLLVLPMFSLGQTYELVPLASGPNTSLRAMSIVSDEVAWVSGNDGSIGKTIDGGTTWQWLKPAGYEKLDFRDIEAFDANRAMVVNAGAPAYILLTTDGGKNWSERYKNLDSAIFLDGMGFWNEKNGMVFGDPIANKLQLLKTRDGGLNWQDVSVNLKYKMADGEAGFAASGTSIKTLGKGNIWIATGGSVANIYRSGNYGITWEKFKCPILQGESSTGTFSIDFYNKNNGVAVGGNYLKSKEHENNVLITNDGGETWKKPLKPVYGYRSAVIYINKRMVVATGTSGTDVSSDRGMNWVHISDLGFNVIQRSKTGQLILLAGSKGELYQLKVSDK